MPRREDARGRASPRIPEPDMRDECHLLARRTYTLAPGVAIEKSPQVREFVATRAIAVALS
jgi:hypothetical protein